MGNEKVENITNLSKINYIFLKSICEYLGITTKISRSIDYKLSEGKTERLVDLCLQANATHYLSGPSAQNYIDKKIFDEKQIVLEWMDYSNYKEYAQLNPNFEHGVSVLDLIFNEGLNSRNFLKY
jgi:hypothetical protein